MDLSSNVYELDVLFRKLGDIYPLHGEDNFRIALTHASSDGKPGANYEQLEFLGDAVLNIVVAENLFFTYPLKKEGELSKMRSWLVSRPQLNKAAEEIGLQAFIHHKIDKKYISKAKDLGGDVLEALLGAFYLDNGLEPVKKIAARWVISPEKVQRAAIDLLDPKSVLHEWSQRRKKKLEFRLLNAHVQNPSQFEVEVWIDGQPYCRGYGLNKKTAERHAAQATISQLDISS